MALRPDGVIELKLPMELTVTLEEDHQPFFGQSFGLPPSMTLPTGYRLNFRLRLNGRMDLHTEYTAMRDFWQEQPNYVVGSALAQFIDLLAEPISQALQDDFTDASRKGKIR